jgi:uncharacterized flavoprotein (TIGR03862 family)
MIDHLCAEAVIVGGGPAGLMAAEALAQAGHRVAVYDAMPSMGRKLLRAGIGGLNITHSEAYERFWTRYGERSPQLRSMLDNFRPEALRAWVHDLGITTFVGSSGRVFPDDMKAAPLLRAWLQRLRRQGVQFHTRHRWLGWTDEGQLLLQHASQTLRLQPQVTVLALGGGSWPQLGSDGAWVPWLRARGIAVTSLASANCGFDVDWTPHLREKFAGAPLKSLSMTVTDVQGRAETRRGELVISAYGVEGSLVYAFSHTLRTLVQTQGQARFTLDLLPDRDADWVLSQVSHPRGSRSWSSHLQSRVGLSGVKTSLLFEVLDQTAWSDPSRIAACLKALPLSTRSARPLAEAISTAGGVAFEALSKDLMLRGLPGVFVAGEMLDWEAPTGGYLLNGCLATGRWAGLGAASWLAQ